MTALGASAAQAQATFYTVTYVEASPQGHAAGHRAAQELRRGGKKDDGNVSFELVKGIHRPTWFAVIGAWKDQKAFEAHVAGAHSKYMNEKIKAHVAAPNDTRQHNALVVRGGARAARPASARSPTSTSSRRSARTAPPR